MTRDAHTFVFVVGMLRVLLYLSALFVVVHLRSPAATFVMAMAATNASVLANHGSPSLLTVFAAINAPVLCLVMIRFAKYEAHRRAVDHDRKERVWTHRGPRA